MPEFFDDSDMKIAGERVPSVEEPDWNGFLAESSKQHFNGNIAKAKALGGNIVSAFSYRAAPAELVDYVMEHGVVPTEDVLLQVRFLSVFSAEYCLDRFLPSVLLAQIAKSEMYDVLMAFSDDFYDSLARSGAFSFYYMGLKRGNDDAAAVGEQFAVLCGAPGDEKLVALGRDLHNMNVTVFKKAINGFLFV